MRLQQLRGLPEMRDFLLSGGQLYIATENRPFEEVARLYTAGHRHFAEKYVQQSVARFGPVRSEWKDMRLSCYGHLQTNKAGRAVHIYNGIESIGSERLAQHLRRCIDTSRDFSLGEILIQVNQGREPQKSGVWPEQAQRLIDHCRDIALPLVGLMSIPPCGQHPKPFFRELRALADSNRLEHCQMGMSDDWQQAISCGSTRIRLGRAIFGNKTSWNGLVKS